MVKSPGEMRTPPYTNYSGDILNSWVIIKQEMYLKQVVLSLILKLQGFTLWKLELGPDKRSSNRKKLNHQERKIKDQLPDSSLAIRTGLWCLRKPLCSRLGKTLHKPTGIKEMLICVHIPCAYVPHCTCHKRITFLMWTFLLSNWVV